MSERAIWAKGRHESASLIGQWVHDTLPPMFDGIDVDFVVWKRSRRCLRIVEEKLAGERIYPSQTRLLPVLAGLVAAGVRAGTLAADSGVFVLHWWQASELPVGEESRFRITRFLDDGTSKIVPATGADALALAAGEPIALEELFGGTK